MPDKIYTRYEELHWAQVRGALEKMLRLSPGEKVFLRASDEKPGIYECHITGVQKKSKD